jgi:hypothetical protein
MNNRLGDLPDWANEPDDDDEEEEDDKKGYTPGTDIEKGTNKDEGRGG